MSMLHEAKRCGLFPFSWNEYVARSNNEKKKEKTSVCARDAYLRWVSGNERERDRDRREH